MDGYYLFNVAIQSINTIIFAFILNLFLRSFWLSLFFSLALGLSRFSYYNISQLYNGGALEGIAITFFLLCLYHILKVLTSEQATTDEKKNGMLWAILFANLSMYAHERYIVLIPFILLLILFFPALRQLSVKGRIGLALATIGTILLNVVIKKFIYSIPFFVGTGGTNIEFSFSNAFSFLIDGLFSIAQINKGPQYLVGIEFTSLPALNKLLTCLVFLAMLVALLAFLYKVFIAVFRAFLALVIVETALKPKEHVPHLHIFVSLAVLFFMLIVPAIVTIRIEQRWLQASFAVFIILVIIAFNRFRFRNNQMKYGLLSLFMILFLFNDFIYLNKGADNIYMSNAKRLAVFFKTAMDKNVLHANTQNIYIVEKKRHVNDENEVIWSIGGGTLFHFYQDKSKNLLFIDSVYQRATSASDTTLKHFNKNTDQIIYITNEIVDITEQFNKDSLRNFAY